MQPRRGTERRNFSNNLEHSTTRPSGSNRRRNLLSPASSFRAILIDSKEGVHGRTVKEVDDIGGNWISQVQLNYLAVASDLGKVFGWSSGLALMYFPLWVVLFMAAFMGVVCLRSSMACYEGYHRFALYPGMLSFVLSLT
ncbi:hypothetical protein OIU77_023224 [Salix suchowensis]|uniref:Nodulin-like domain-containing protein n=1 Tax=Salix suchowensis TaxID=1278906 RepID=A0ABQ9C667_9ROSI|nr:hypothetical protein OIU77_023224 [Salix suchowensis]